jgi:hypothetical protein
VHAIQVTGRHELPSFIAYDALALLAAEVRCDARGLIEEAYTRKAHPSHVRIVSEPQAEHKRFGETIEPSDRQTGFDIPSGW